MSVLLSLIIFLSSCNPSGVTGGTFLINGTANSSNFSNFSASWSEEENPDDWSEAGIELIGNGVSAVESGNLTIINSASWLYGNKIIRLRVCDSLGMVSEDYVYLRIDNTAFTYPEDKGFVLSNTTINITGRILHPNFQNYTIQYCNISYGDKNCSSDFSVEQISLMNDGLVQVENDVLANWTTPLTNSTLAFSLSIWVNLNDSTQETESIITVYVMGPDDYEPDDNYSLASWMLTNGSNQSHSFHQENDYDYIKFNMTENQAYQIKTFGLSYSSCDTVLVLYDTDGTTQLKFNDDTEYGFVDLSSQIIWEATANGTYYINASSYAGAAGGSYYITIREVNLSDIYEPDDNYSLAGWMLTNGSSQHHTFYNIDNFPEANDYDMVKFNATAGSFYKFETSHLQGDAETGLDLYDTNGMDWIDGADDGGSENDASRFVRYFDTNGTYYVGVQNWRSWDVFGCQYDLDVELVDSYVDSYEPDDNHTLAKWILTNGSGQEHNFFDISIDYVKFNATKGSGYTILTYDLDLNLTDTVLILFDTTGTNVLDLEDNCYDPLCEYKAAMINWQAEETGTYFVQTYQVNWQFWDQNSHPESNYSYSIKILDVTSFSPPEITSYYPDSSTASITTKQSLTFNITFSDANQLQDLRLRGYRDGNLEIDVNVTNETTGNSSTSTYTYEYGPDYLRYTFIGSAVAAGTYDLEFNVSDGYDSTNQGWALTVGSSGSTGGGGGGGGGGGTTTPPGYSRYWDVLPSGENKASILQNDYGIKEIDFYTDETAKKVRFGVEKLAQAPTTLSLPAGEVFKYLKITVENLSEEEIKGDVKMKFLVTQTWLADTHLKPEDVVLMRYYQGVWNDLSTKVISSDAQYANFEAVSPGFSYFAIGEKPALKQEKLAAITGDVVANETILQPEQPAQNTEEEKLTESPAQKEQSPSQKEVSAPEDSKLLFIFISLFIIVFLGSGLFLFFRRKQGQEISKEEGNKEEEKTAAEQQKPKPAKVKFRKPSLKQMFKRKPSKDIVEMNLWIKNAMKNGFFAIAIKKKLLMDGWKEEVVDAELEKVQKEKANSYADELAALVKEGILAGYDAASLKKILLQKGLPEELIEKAIDDFRSEPESKKK